MSQQQNLQKKPLAKNLTFHEVQAYEGAKNFYYCFIPTIMVSLLFAYLYLLELHLRSVQTQVNYYAIFSSLLLFIFSFFSYFLALKVYRKCNDIDVTPVISSFQLSDRVKMEDNEGEKEVNEDGEGELMGGKRPRKYVCSACNLVCEYRTRHCKKCQVCVQRFDHHCFWIGNCVGRHNQLPFYLFLLYQTINNVLNFILLVNFMDYLQQLEDSVHLIVKCSIICLELFDLGFIAFTGYLLVYHTMLISNGITTWEHMRRRRISYLKHLPPGFNPFSKGIVNNWKTFLTEPTRNNGQATVQNWETDVPTFQESQKLKPVFNLIDNEYYSCC